MMNNMLLVKCFSLHLSDARRLDDLSSYHVCINAVLYKLSRPRYI